MTLFWLVAMVTAATGGPVPLSTCASEFAGIPSPVWTEGLAEARRILAAAGVEVTWTRCNPGQEDRAIRVYSVASAPVKPSDLGLALPEVHRIYVVAPHVAKRAGGNYREWIVVLGCVIAHEIGHIAGLSHAPRGLMHSHWSVEDLHAAAAGRLTFTEEQGRTLRTWAILWPPLAPAVSESPALSRKTASPVGKR